VEVIVYAKAPEDGFCGQCVATKRALTSGGVVFREILIGNKERTMLVGLGFTAAPVVEVRGVDPELFTNVPGVTTLGEDTVGWCGMVPSALDVLKTLPTTVEDTAVPRAA